VIVKIIQPDLAPGDHPGIARQLLHLGKVPLLGQRRLMRMHANRGVDA
jgi:hypothetical protein